MDIANLALSLNQIDLATQISTSVTKMAMNDGCDAALKMTEMMSDPNLGNLIDMRA